MAVILKANLSDNIIEYITGKIIKMEYSPGERIIESKIAKELNISHSPIREALRVLERNKLVEHIPRKGVFVTELHEPYVETLFEVVTELLVLVMKKMIINADSNDIAKLKNISENAMSVAKINNKDAYYNRIMEFAFAGLAAGKNKLLEQIIFELVPSLRRILYLSFAFDETDLLGDAAILVEGTRAICERNSERAETLFRKWVAIQKDNSISGLKTGNFF